MKSNTVRRDFVLASLFSAIIIIMAFTPLGYIPLGFINATIIQVPVIIGALFCGPKQGAFLGFLFGFTSFLKNTLMPATASAFVFSPVLAGNLFGIKGVLLSSFICFVPRILVGIVPYYTYRVLCKVSKNKTLRFALSGILGAFTNTILVMGSIFLFYKDSYATALNIAASTVANLIGGIIGFNGTIEAIISGVIVSAVGIVLIRIRPIPTKQA